MSDQNKWTPGPWEVEDPLGPELLSIVEAGKLAHEWRFIAQVDAEGEDGIPIRQAKANARLIAAAPDFAEQAEWNRTIRDRVDALLAESGYAENCSMRNFLSQMNFDALRKARGEA